MTTPDPRAAATYTRQQKGHSVTKHALLACCTAGISLLWTWYYSKSPNHFFHT